MFSLTFFYNVEIRIAQRITIAGLGAALLLSLLAYWVHLSVRIAHQSTEDEAQTADVIIVMGAAEYRGRPSPVLRARLDHALVLWRRKLAPRIMTTGGPGGDPVFTEADVGRSYLMDRGIPAPAIITEAEGTSTMHSISAAAEIMRRMDLKSCILVSDGYHIFRAKRMLQHLGLKVYGSPRETNAPDFRKSWFLYFRQAVGFTLWKIGITI